MDQVSLARLVVAGFVKMQNNPAVTAVTVWGNPVMQNEINKRFAACLQADEASSERGVENSRQFLYLLNVRRNMHLKGLAACAELGCVHIAQMYLSSYEQNINPASLVDSSRVLAERPVTGKSLALPTFEHMNERAGHHRGGNDSRSRRALARQLSNMQSDLNTHDLGMLDD